MDKQTAKSFAMRVSQSSPTELVVVSYDIILQDISDMRKGLKALNSLGSKEKAASEEFNKQRDEIGDCSGHASRVIADLMSALDFKYDISKNLWSLYEFVQMKIIRARYSMSEEDLNAAEDVITGLRKSFAQISKNDTRTSMKNTQSVFAGLTYSKNSLDEISIDPNHAKRGFLA